MAPADGKEEFDVMLEQWITADELRILKVSAARFNPRSRGKLLRSIDREVRPALLHAGLALAHSQEAVPTPASG